MALYLISYDNAAPRDYTRLYDLLGSWKAQRVLQSVWLASLTGTAAQVRDAVGSALGTNDKVIVIELKPNSDWAGLRAELNGIAWLRTNVRA